VRANVAGAAVSLDGTRVGLTGSDPVVIADVSPGQHEVSVEKPGYTTTKQEFTLAAGQSLPLSLAMSPVSVEVRAQNNQEPVPVTPPPPGETEPTSEGSATRSLARVGFWVAAVGTVASAALAVKYGNDVRNINSQLDKFRQFPCGGGLPGFCTTPNGTTPAPPRQPGDQMTINQKTADGNHAQTMQWVFIALAPPFAAAGVYLLYKGYLQSESGTEAGHASANHGLRIFPTASASAGGIIAEFDF
jgi:hypothetical protein